MIAARFVSGWFRLCIVLLFIAHISACSKSEPEAESKPAEQASLPGEKSQQCNEAKPGGPEDVVRTLYQQYPFSDNKVLKNEPKETLDKYLDTRFASALLMNQACEDATSEVCAINADIMYDAQDGKISDLKVCAMNAARNTVQVRFKNSGLPQSVTYKLSNVTSGWKIGDIVGADDSNNWSFVADLEKHYQDLGKGWDKAQGHEQISENAKIKDPLPHCEPARAGGPEDLVRSLYEQYPWKGDRIIINESRETLQKYFDESMVKTITDNQARRAAAKHLYLPMPNAMINQEMNYVQDISGFRICAMDAAAKTINVQFRDAGEPRIVTYKLADTSAGPRIAGVYATEGVHPMGSGKGDQWSMADALSAPLEK
jgi:hypothetical protein